MTENFLFPDSRLNLHPVCGCRSESVSTVNMPTQVIEILHLGTLEIPIVVKNTHNK